MLMDDIDRKILKLLQENARMSLKTIAEKTFLSSPAVSARIEKLEKDGVIAGYHAMVDPMKLGYHILAFINLDVIPEDKPKFYAYAESVPNVLECSCVTGEYSMLMKVAFQTTMELDIFIGQLQKFGKTSTQIVFSTPVGPRGIQIMESENGGKEAAGKKANGSEKMEGSGKKADGAARSKHEGGGTVE